MENSKFTQLCVWFGTIVGSDNVESFKQFFLDELKTRVEFLTEIETNPDLDSNGNPIPETGGRNDVFFFVHSDDIGHFAIPRLALGIRWWEDVIKYNKNSSHLYPQEFIEKHQPTW